MDTSHAQRGRFAFLIHPRTDPSEDLALVNPLLGLLPGRLVEAALVTLRDVSRVAGEIDLAPASNALKRAYALLQSTSESRFGMTMVDFRHACCTCGAIK